MKRKGYLFDELISYDNIKLAIKNSSKSKRNKPHVKRILDNEYYYITKIQAMLITGNFSEEHKYVKETIKDGKKERDIIKEDYYPWQILQHAFIQVLNKGFRSSLINTTCSCIKGRGVHYAHKCVRHSFRNNPDLEYFWQVDFRKFYASISHDIIHKTLINKIKDKRVINLFEKLVFTYESPPAIYDILNQEVEKYSKYYSNYPQNISKVNIKRGITIGAYTSQMIANWVLSSLDHYMKEEIKCKSYIRYCDDVLGFAKTKEEAIYQASKYIEKAHELGFIVKANIIVSPIHNNDFGNWINFLGLKYSKSDGIRLQYFIRNRFKSKYNKAKSLKRKDEIKNSYKGWCLISNSKNLYFSITGERLQYDNMLNFNELILNEDFQRKTKYIYSTDKLYRLQEIINKPIEIKSFDENINCFNNKKGIIFYFTFLENNKSGKCITRSSNIKTILESIPEFPVTNIVIEQKDKSYIFNTYKL